jgi:hypothetical protein
MKFFYGIVLIFSILIANNSCKKITSYPPEPALEFKSFQLIDATDTLNNKVKSLDVEFSFIDGDGDLFSPIDTANSNSPVSKLFWTYYEKQKGEFVQVPDSLLKTPTSSHLPYSDLMQRNGQNKTQKGTIKYTYLFYYPLPYDTLEIEFYIVDMAEHKSNVVRTPQIVLQ